MNKELNQERYGSIGHVNLGINYKTLDEGPNSNDIGFGEKVLNITKRRMINRDGSFNVKRKGFSFIRSRSLYHYAISCTWPKFIFLVVFVNLLTNCIFALIYFLLGKDSFNGMLGETFFSRILESFFFSVQTLATIGYGQVNPKSIIANSVVTIESIVGLFMYAVASGLVFARSSRPSAKIIFSNKALISPYNEITGFMFRVVNERQNQILNLEARLLLSLYETEGNINRRKFYELKLERRQVLFFPLHWTIVHPIDKESPLFGKTEEQLFNTDAEFLVLLSGLDDGFAQTVSAYNSYKLTELVWGAKFTDILEEQTDGLISIDLNRIHEYSKVQLPRNDNSL
jgi:inward rectifier potassium channel